MDDSTYQLAVCIPVKDLYLLCGLTLLSPPLGTQANIWSPEH